MKKFLIPWIIFIGTMGVLAVWFAWMDFCPGIDLQSQGQFGDKFGALNTLFTGLAFVGVIAALWHERDGAADREREHRELIDVSRAQIAVAAHTARVAAITARIEGYTQQLVQHHLNVEACNRLRFEREQLFRELDKAYQNPPTF